MRRGFLLIILGALIYSRWNYEPPKPCTCEHEQDDDPDEKPDYYKRELGDPVA